MPDSSLASLFKKYEHLTDKDRRHGYSVFYERLFGHLRNEHLRILEIGMSGFGGGSLMVFADFFPNATIIGADNDLTSLTKEVRRRIKRSKGRIQILKCDAYDVGAFNGMEQVDIIIDDCVHNWGRQTKLLMRMFDKVNPGGMYIIEEACKRPKKLRPPSPDKQREFIESQLPLLDLNLEGFEICFGKHGSHSTLLILSK